MKNIFEKICNYLELNQQGMLATIVWTSGSTPAPAQSKMLLGIDGNRIAGTIGGGCVEDAVMRRGAAIQDKKYTVILDFELNDDDAETGLICGGTLKVLIEPINISHQLLFQKLAERCDAGLETILVTKIGKDNNSEKSILDKNSQLLAGELREIKSFPKNVLEKFTPVMQNFEDDLYIYEPIEGKSPLYIFGGGHVGKAVSRFAAQCGFSVTIVDDRVEYTDRDKFPEVDKTICLPFRNISEHLKIEETAFVIIVTRGHSYDELVLEQVLKFKPKYIGMIGSKRKVLVSYKNLLAKGVEEAKLKNIFAPVGLDIGAISVEEIAVSIVAEMVSVRRKNITHSVSHKKISY
ncbi:MAG: XdhC family protein [Bacteroidota bacterium]|nr:XdhC family protein [Bacteroidota bacterium]